MAAAQVTAREALSSPGPQMPAALVLSARPRHKSPEPPPAALAFSPMDSEEAADQSSMPQPAAEAPGQPGAREPPEAMAAVEALPFLQSQKAAAEELVR